MELQHQCIIYNSTLCKYKYKYINIYIYKYINININIYIYHNFDKCIPEKVMTEASSKLAM